MLDLQSLAAGDLDQAGVDAEQVEDRGVDVRDVMAVLDGMEAELVGGAVDESPPDSAAGQPDREAVVVVVAAVGPLRAGCPTELGRPDDDRLIEQPPALEVDQEPRDRAVDLAQRAEWLARRPVWASQAPAAPSPWKTWMNRTPRSLSRRAARSCCPNGRVTSWSSP